MKLENIGFYTLEDKRAKNVSLNSPLWRCELLLNNKCNFNCIYCRDKKGDYEISFEKAKQIIDLWADEGLKNIRFSGGEPTLYPNLLSLIKYTKEKYINRIALSTNGSANLNYYKHLIQYGVNDFSISLDSCCASIAQIMAGKKINFDKIINNIKELSKLTYVTVGVVLNENNLKDLNTIILFCDNLGVSDIRIIPAAQFDNKIHKININKKLLKKYPILKYRVNNILKNKSVRGLIEKDNNKCPLIIDDMAIKDLFHYPCIIKLREGCKPIGMIGKNMRKERFNYYKKHDCYKDNICKNNCLDVCIEYNNKVKKFNKEQINEEI
jgi:MoaA/NifB/PqqE/SkfB family radical SAM enzyme